MSALAHLAIDLGAESGRCIVGLLDGDSLTLHEVHRFAHRPCRLPSGLHWDLTGIWLHVLEGLSAAGAFCRSRAVPLVSVGVDTWGVDYALIGRSGELLGLPHAYRDERNQPAFERTIAAVGRGAIYDATGIQFMPLNTLYQLVAAQDAEPTTLAQSASLLFMPDLFHYFLSGHGAVEQCIASTSQMIDPRTGGWATGLLARLGLPTHMLAAPVPPGTTLGVLRPEVARATGQDPRIRVIVPASHDTASAVAAVPAAPGTRWCFLSSGTWSLLGAEIDAPCLSPGACEVPFTNERGVGNTIRFLKNIAGLWLVQECRRDWESRGEPHSYEELAELAAAGAPFRTLIDVNHRSFAHPGEMTSRIAEFARATGQPIPQEPGQVVRCCLESLALEYRRTLGQLERVLGRTFDTLHIVGGGARNNLLNRMTAGATGRRTVVGPVEATAAGNVLTQAMGTGTVRDLAHIRRIAARSFQPATIVPTEAPAWDAAFERYLGLLSS